MIQYGDEPWGGCEYKIVLLLWLLIFAGSIFSYYYYPNWVFIIISILVLNLLYLHFEKKYSYVYNTQSDYLIATSSSCFGAYVRQAEVKLNICDIGNTPPDIVYKNPFIQKTDLTWKPVVSHPLQYYGSKHFSNTDVTKKIAAYLNLYDFYAFKMASEQIQMQLLNLPTAFLYRKRLAFTGMVDVMVDQMSKSLQIVIK
jgi:hypothetical protein